MKQAKAWTRTPREGWHFVAWKVQVDDRERYQIGFGEVVRLGTGELHTFGLSSNVPRYGLLYYPATLPPDPVE